MNRSVCKQEVHAARMVTMELLTIIARIAIRSLARRAARIPRGLGRNMGVQRSALIPSVLLPDPDAVHGVRSFARHDRLGCAIGDCLDRNDWLAAEQQHSSGIAVAAIAGVIVLAVLTGIGAQCAFAPIAAVVGTCIFGRGGRRISVRLQVFLAWRRRADKHRQNGLPRRKIGTIQIGCLLIDAVVQRLLLQAGQNCRSPTQRPLFLDGCVGQTRNACPRTGKAIVVDVIAVQADAQLLQIVQALNTPRSLTCRLDCRQQERD